MLYVDIPTPTELAALVAARGEAFVTVYLPTTPETQNIDAARTRLGQLLKQAEAKLEEAGAAKRTIWPIAGQVHDLMDDNDFWAHQANALAIFVTPERIVTHRLPNHLTEMVEVSDRFFLKPLLRATTVPQHAFVLALAEGEVRLVEVTEGEAGVEIRVPGMPKDAASAVGTASVNSRSYSGRIGGSEGQKVLLTQFCRKVDAALRPVLAGRSEPLILAAAEPLATLFRAVCTYPNLAERIIEGSPARVVAADLGQAARAVMDARHADEVARLKDLYARRENEGRATTQLARAARAATFGAIETLMVDIDVVVPGLVDEETGAIQIHDALDATNYGVIDEIAGRVLANGGRVLGLRRGDIPEGGDLAAILRYAI
ncbi:hypothetical protein [Rhodovulum steppense]|uniref:Peptide subunit release factor 1 (ERF1) n=1 Tax=Rhodovulum steppense TaxID=540251 RepID=A0A4R1YTI6_9RHOB|nr:hypothetical protein [Rhodovulum steppense]TCM84369.1 hypothetical protein EV216_1125 [Rhodovulum steppense]